MRSAPKPWTKYFLVYWAIAAILLYLSWNVIPQRFFDVMGFYMASTFVVVIIVIFREQRYFMKYLKNTYLKKWEEVTSVPSLGMGPGGRNSFRVIGFVYSDDNYDDPILMGLKNNFKKIIPWALVVPVSHVGLMLFLVYVGVLHKA